MRRLFINSLRWCSPLIVVIAIIAISVYIEGADASWPGVGHSKVAADSVGQLPCG